MTVSVKAPTSTTGSIQLNGSDVLTIDSSGNLTAPNNLTANGSITGDGSGLTAIPAANLTGTLPALNGSSLTNLPAPTTAQVLTANAGLTYGDVGTYALLANESGTSQLTPGSTLAGSSLSAANTYNSTGNSGRSNFVPSGTWRLCGQTGYYNDTSTAAGVDRRVSLWVRIS